MVEKTFSDGLREYLSQYSVDPLTCPIDGTEMEYGSQDPRSIYYGSDWYHCPTCGFNVSSRVADDSDIDELYRKARDYINNEIQPKILTDEKLDARISEMKDLNERYKIFVENFKANYEKRKADHEAELGEKYPECYPNY